ncbi:NADH dehydrogenase subunit 3 (mitochondrion) [Mercenaria mercenaria]|uniref:NADH-ubiquinone oxidoreductase chain 3 n=1 Tax=Mercenaria mercenaria TaxID=6596 RepID=A0A6H0JQN3_MERMC|nr:NADH dehydrogenase subunit 3 [Mercenaria mercenaria]QIU83224.1 NADH dehydrogenase subunit 3 [Mercenaria mercenaria]
MEIFINKSEILGCLKLGFGLLCFVSMVGLLLLFLGFVCGQKWRCEWQKLTAFECGFDALSSTRSSFSMRFFLLALLFLVFDVEIVLLFPYIFSVSISWIKMSLYSKLYYFSFLLVLVLGLIHEMNEGTLDWKFD